YREGRLFLWLPGKAGRFVDRGGFDAWGPRFSVDLDPEERRLFAFKFAAGDWEPDYANKVWASSDGGEVWAHSRSAAVSAAAPARKALSVHFLGRRAAGTLLHLWQEDSDFVVDVAGAAEAGGWQRFETPLYTGRPYRFVFRQPGGPREWEHQEAKREVRIDGDREVWTLEGDRELFAAKPVPDRRVVLEVACGPADCPLGTAGLYLDAWVNRGDLPLATAVAATAAGRYEFDT